MSAAIYIHSSFGAVIATMCSTWVNNSAFIATLKASLFSVENEITMFVALPLSFNSTVMDNSSSEGHLQKSFSIKLLSRYCRCRLNFFTLGKQVPSGGTLMSKFDSSCSTSRVDELLIDSGNWMWLCCRRFSRISRTLAQVRRKASSWI